MISINISTSLLIIISCLILAIIIGLIIFIIIKDRRVDQEEIDDLIEDIVKAKPRDRKDEIKVTKIESSDPEQLNLEQMLNDMQSNLDKKQSKSIETYEKEQDENAIISIKELEKMSHNTEEYEREQEKESVININEINSLDKLKEKEEKVKIPKKETNKKFRNADLISPIFGKVEQHTEYPKIRAYNRDADLSVNEYFGEEVIDKIEETLSVKPLSEEIKRNTEFLNALKEFRNNL